MKTSPRSPMDGTSLVQMFQNLIGNAIRYRSAEAPREFISRPRQSKMRWLFSCRDNGIGIAPQYHAQIFEPFKRLHGMSFPAAELASQCARKSSNATRAEFGSNQNNQGATFYFTVPARSSENERLIDRVEEIAQAPASPESQR